LRPGCRSPNCMSTPRRITRHTSGIKNALHMISSAGVGGC